MTTDGIYKDVLLEHFRHPRNKGELAGAAMIRRGSNPRCGDDIEVGLFLDGDILESVKFRGRGCSLCIASASLMTGAVSGKSRAEAQRLCEQMQSWLGHGAGAHRVDGRIDRAVGGLDDDRGNARLAIELGENLEAVGAGHDEVETDQIRPPVAGEGDTLLRRAGGPHLVALVLQDALCMAHVLGCISEHAGSDNRLFLCHFGHVLRHHPGDSPRRVGVDLAAQ